MSIKTILLYNQQEPTKDPNHLGSKKDNPLGFAEMKRALEVFPEGVYVLDTDSRTESLIVHVCLELGLLSYDDANCQTRLYEVLDYISDAIIDISNDPDSGAKTTEKQIKVDGDFIDATYVQWKHFFFVLEDSFLQAIYVSADVE